MPGSDAGDAGAGGSVAAGADAVGSDDAVVVEGLTRRFGDVVAVDGLSFRVAPGELFGLVGPDGAGKTTSLRMLAAILPPSAGSATVAGHSVAEEPDRVRPHIAYMAQRFGLYEDLTVRENLDFYADLYRVPKGERPRRRERLYAFSNLGEFEDRLAGNLSGGMKQKLSLSCALIHRPRILLLDEPTFGVDPISRRDLWMILHEMVEEGVTIVVSTAYLDEAERCDRVVFLHEGRMLALDRPAALQASFPGRVLEVRAGDARRARDVLRGHAGVGRASLFGESVHAVVTREIEPQAIQRALEAEGLSVVEVRVVPASLEDVFIDRIPVGAHG
jgi:ABC-2 type transport system ATP-binding protein